MSRMTRLSGMLATVLLLASLLPATMLEDLCGGCDEAYGKADIPGAYEFAERAMQVAPQAYEAHWRLVRSLVDQGEQSQDEGRDGDAESWYNRAMESSRQLVEAHPGRSMSHYYRALAVGRRALFAGGKEKVELSREIEREAKIALELDDENGSAHGLIGRYYREMAHLSWVMRTLAETLFGDLPEGGDELSYQHLTRATELRPDWMFAWIELGQTCEVMERHEEAQACYRKVLELPIIDHRDKLLQAQARKKLS